MIEFIPRGTRVGEIILLPDVVAILWLKELGKEKSLKEKEYVSTEQSIWIDGEPYDLAIYRSSTGYRLSINPED